MSTIYSPLNASRREIRLILIHADLHHTAGADASENTIPDGSLECTMKTVSLKDWTSDYADFRARAIDWPYSPTTLYEKWEHFSRQKATFMDDDTLTPDRFIWGDYETISYVWDNGSNTRHTICVNDRPFVIQANLHLALQEFRRSKDFVEGRNRMLWVDAICINQNDLDERATEVKRMKEIFSTAIKSTIWLGTSLDLKGKGTQGYFDLIDDLIDNLYPLALPNASLTEGLRPESTELASPEAGPLDGDNPEDRESQTGLEEALALISQFDPAERPPIFDLTKLSPDERLLALLFPTFCLSYWTRVWIIQELTVSSSRTVVRVGSSQILFAQLSWFAECFVKAVSFGWSANDRYLRRIEDTLVLLKTVYETQHQFQPDELESDSDYMLIIQGLMSRSSLPLDKLYGVLGLLQPAACLGIDVDYRKTIGQGSIDAAIVLIRAGEEIRTFDIRREFQCLRVPSWTVDLSVNYDPMSSVAMYFHKRSSAMIPEVDWEVFWARQVGQNEQGILSLRGTYVDTVDGIAACMPAESRSPENSPQEPAVLRNIGHLMTEPTQPCHSYIDDSEMLGSLDAILRNVPNWEADGIKNTYYTEGYADVFKLSNLAGNLNPVSGDSPGLRPFQVRVGTAINLSSLKQFLDASSGFRLWTETLSVFVSGIAQEPEVNSSSPTSASQMSDSSSFWDADALTTLEDMMPNVHLWTLPQVRLITTTNGYLGVAAQLVRQGDMVYAVEGYGCPVLLRPIRNADTFEFIGLAEIWSPAVSGTWENMSFDCIVKLQ